VLQPDIAHAGGFTELSKIAAMAEAHFATIAAHCPLSPLSFAASIQFAAATPNYLVQEHNEVNDSRIDGKTVIGKGYMCYPFVLDEDGCVSVPDRPGIGVELDPDFMNGVMTKPWHMLRG
jgi:galactonate dehydratase